MRLVIDKDFKQRTVLQESYDKDHRIYTVKAVNESDKFVYAKGLTINEAKKSVCDLAVDPIFTECSAQLVETVNGKEKIVWSSCGDVVVESTVVGEGLADWFKDKWDAFKKSNFAKGFGALADKFTSSFKASMNGWLQKSYITKDNEVTGLGWKLANGEQKPEDEDGKAAVDAIKKLIQAYQDNVKQEIQKQKGEVTNIEVMVNGDNNPVSFFVTYKVDDNEIHTILSQKGESKPADAEGNPAKDASQAVTNSEGKPATDADTAGAESGEGGEGSEGSGNTQAITPEQAAKDPKAALGNLATRVANIEKEIGIAESSKKMVWNFNGKQNTDKQGMERLAISTFFKTLNESNIKGIKFVDFNGNVKSYDLSNGSTAYAQFKKDFKESTSNANGKFAEYKFTIKNKATESKLSGFKFSDFGDIEKFTESKDIVLTASVVDFKTGGDDDTKTKTSPVTESKDEQKVETKEVVNESLVLEMDVVNPTDQIKALVASMNKFTSGKPETSPLTKPTANVSTPVSTFGMPEQEIVTEEGEEEADPFAGGDDGGGDDAGGDDAGGGDDPFGGGDDAGGDDAGGGDEGGDDAGGDDPFGGDSGGDDAGAEGGDDAAAEDPNDPTGEPAADPAINTDAQGNQKSQYNINVTKAFNVDDSFELNEEEQQEFFGKIDQLVKIPDMENYALYLYQITPDNVNLDDVHYITALYELSVKLGLLEDVYADSNLLEKYSSYKYSVVKNGEEGENGQDEMTIQEGRKYAIMEGTDKPKVQKDNEEKTEKSKKVGSSKDDDERRGPKDMKLNKDKNGVDKPVIIDANEYGWENKDKKLSDATEMADFRGLGWVVTFKAMQFGSPRYMTMYIKKNGNEKAETQCKKYLEKLSYSEIDIVKIEEIDPYEYVYRNGASGMKSVEEVHGAAVVNKDIPYLESTKEEAEQPSIAKEGAMSQFVPDDIKRDVKGVLTKLNAEIRNTKQFNFANECGIYKPQVDHVEFMNCYRTAKVDETIGDTTYKFILKKNDSMMSRMFYSNLQEKLFKYLGTFATKYNMECNCQACPTYIVIDFVRNDLNNPMGYDLDTMIDTEEPIETSSDEALPEVPAI